MRLPAILMGVLLLVQVAPRVYWHDCHHDDVASTEQGTSRLLSADCPICDQVAPPIAEAADGACVSADLPPVTLGVTALVMVDGVARPAASVRGPPAKA